MHCMWSLLMFKFDINISYPQEEHLGSSNKVIKLAFSLKNIIGFDKILLSQASRQGQK